VEDETRQQVCIRNKSENRLVFDFVRAMNIARRNLVAYPRGHALVIESFEKVRAILENFFECNNHFTLGIAKDTLMLGTKALDKKNPVFQNFAHILFEHGIVSLTFFRNITVDELMDFDHIISQKRNDVQHQGGVETLLVKAKVHNIKAKLIDYRMFQTQTGLVDTETDRENAQESLFWWHFVQGVMDGTLDPLGLPLDGIEAVDPKDLAAIINKQFGSHGGLFRKGLEEGGSVEGEPGRDEGLSSGESVHENPDIEGPNGGASAGQGPCGGDSGEEIIGRKSPGFSAFLDSKKLDFCKLAHDETSTARLNRFVMSLNHSLRKTFIERFLSSFSHNTGALNQIIPGLSDEIIIEALESNAQKELYIPPNILDILERLHKESASKDSRGTDELPNDVSKEELAEKFSVIFKEDELDRFVPLDYQKILHHVVLADTLSAPELSQVRQLEDTLSSQSIQMHLTAVVVDIISQGDGVTPPYLAKALKDCCMFLISIGDFHAVSEIYETVVKKTGIPGSNDDAKSGGIIEVFADDDFIGSVLDGPAQWGKEKDFYIVELIKNVGRPFVEPLLDRLASEEDRTLRYFYLDLLGELGPSVKEPAIKRLKDNQWFLVRNLIILLRNLNDPSVLPALHNLLEHPHPRVRHELMQTLIKFNDPVAERIILQEMDSPDTGRCLKAIALAGMTRNRLVSQKLLEFLKQRGLGKTMLPIKKASVHALGEIGDPSALPILQDILKTRAFFRRHAAMNLKLEIIDTLKKYPAGVASPILRGLAGSGPQSLANQARAIMKGMEVGQS
jgi:hypothetical protein